MISKTKTKTIMQLKKARNNFAGIGTRKAKIRLNKKAKTDPLAKAIRIALEIEDKSITAKKTFGKWQEKTYRQKNFLIAELIELFKSEGWYFGVHKSDVQATTHIIYFEIPNCEQISFHYTPDKKLPGYAKKWDGKRNSTLKKVEALAADILKDTITKNDLESLPKKKEAKKKYKQYHDDLGQRLAKLKDSYDDETYK
tara:strand:+ start:21942 stop:22535 length:594 start_codon:yes stop_codon:yes gene_type:complete